MQRAVHRADPVACHLRPVRIDRPHRHGVGRLRLEQAPRALLDLLGEVGGQRVERDLLRAHPADLTQRESELRHGHRQHVALAVVQVVGDLEAVEDVLVRGAVVTELDARQTARAQRHDAIDVLEIGPLQQRIADVLERLPVLDVSVEARRAHERRPRLGPLGKAPSELEEGVARLGPVLQPLEREPQIEGVLGGARPVGGTRDEQPVGVHGILPALLHERPLAPARQLGLGGHLGRRDDPRLRVDVGRRPQGDRRRGGAAGGEQRGQKQEPASASHHGK